MSAEGPPRGANCAPPGGSAAATAASVGVQNPRPKLVVVGNGMAGMRTVEELLKLAPDLYEITVFGAEPHPNYNRILLSPVLAGEQTLSEIVLNPRQWYIENDIELRTGTKVTRIDRARRVVEADDGTVAPYDRLLLATGSNPFILPITGTDLPGVITYRDIADTEAMIDAASHFSRAVVIGGGLLGLEAANGLRRRGMDVTVVHLMPWLMERQLDRMAAELLQRSLEAKGLAFRLEAKTEALIAGEDGRVCGVRLASGEMLAADLVVMAVGIRPNVDLAKSAGLHCDRGVVVNDTLQTFDPRIYAIGECVAHRGQVYGLVAPLFEMAKVCANHLAGYGIGQYAGSQLSTKLKVTGIDLFSAGNFTGGADTEEIVLSDPCNGVYKKLVLKDDKLIGGVLYGDTVDGAWYFKLMRDRQSVAEIRDRLMFGEALPEAKTSFASNEDALVKLITDKTIDVVAVVAGQPAKLLVDMKPEARQFIKLLKFDPNHAASKAALRTYFPATVRANSYPNLLTDDVPGLAVKAFLVTYDYNLKGTQDYLSRFARSLCQNLPVLQEKGHPKWREVELSLPDLGRGWFYYPPTAKEIRSCVAARTKPKTPPVKPCTQQERILGLCG